MTKINREMYVKYMYAVSFETLDIVLCQLWPFPLCTNCSIYVNIECYITLHMN